MPDCGFPVLIVYGDATMTEGCTAMMTWTAFAKSLTYMGNSPARIVIACLAASIRACEDTGL